MKILPRYGLAAAQLAATLSLTAAPSVFPDFISVRGDQLMEGGRPFRFISFNIPNLHLVEDNLPFMITNAWRLPDRFEIVDALESTRQAGGTVARIYVLSVVRTNDTPDMPRHVLGPGRFNEEAFRALDQVLQVANETGVRLIIPFVDNWSWWGGAAEYARFRGKPREAFWTDPEVIADFKKTVAFVLTRTNSITGLPYRDDKAVLGWETGNELQSPAAWTREIAAYIKQLAPRQLVIDGYHSTVLREESLAMPEVDVVTTHHYPGGKETYAQLIRENWAKAKGRKPYFVGEFGFVETPVVAATLDAVSETGTAGALIWSLRPRSRDGGFYWHSEPAGGDKYKAYHWPGFASGADYDEAGVLALMRKRAFALRGLAEPPLPVPAAPSILPASQPGALSWQGAAGARHYQVQRAPAASGPWTLVGADVNDAALAYRPVFVDSSVPVGTWYYRVLAANESGTSPPSKVVGPVVTRYRLFVDEMADASRWHAREGKLEFRTHEARRAKEDSHRTEGAPGSAIVYRVEGPILGFRADTFSEGSAGKLRFFASTDGTSYRPVEAEAQVVDGGPAAAEYGYWVPVRFHARLLNLKARYLRVEFSSRVQIGRVEIAWGK
jgi:hypothetical protein